MNVAVPSWLPLVLPSTPLPHGPIHHPASPPSRAGETAPNEVKGHHFKHISMRIDAEVMSKKS